MTESFTIFHSNIKLNYDYFIVQGRTAEEEGLKQRMEAELYSSKEGKHAAHFGERGISEILAMHARRKRNPPSRGTSGK